MNPGQQNKYFLGEVQKDDGLSWMVNLKVRKMPVKFKIDTEADVSVVPENTWREMGAPQLSKPEARLISPGGELECLGEFTAQTTLKAQQYSFKVVVLKGSTTNNLLSRDTAIKMGLVARLDEVSQKVKTIGLMKTSPVKIELRPDAEPYCLYTARNVPFPMMDAVKKELDRMVASNVIRPVTTPSEWCAPMVPVPKSNGQVRICVDLQRLNKAVKREHLVLPTLDDIAPNLAGSSVFSSLDAESGFWQIPLEKDSQELTTFISPFGRFCFQRLPFGVTSASEIFQRKMQDLLQDQEGVEVIVDDILVHGKTRDEHDTRLKKVIETVNEAGLTLNYQKCQFQKEELTYFGHVVGAKGIRPDPEKVRALVDMPSPTKVEELRRVLGMLNYLGRFVSNLSTIMKPMLDLLKSDAAWAWGPHQEQAFKACKDLVGKAPNLQFYDASLPTVISADASSYGLGAVLQQVHDGALKPVAFCSRTLTETEQGYAQIEKECLAAVWACEKFRRYLVGLPSFTLQTDHKPLVPLLSTKPLHQAPVRCQCLLLRMLRFNFEVQHIPGKHLIVPDALSRSPLAETDSDSSHDLASEVAAHVDAIQTSWPASGAKLQEYKRTTEEDEELQTVRKFISGGWPRHATSVPPSLLPYFKAQNDLSAFDGLITFQNRIVISKAQRGEVLKRLHASHQGLSSCRERAQSSVWWPGISQDIKNAVLNCEWCRQHRPAQRHEPLKPSELPSRPWSKLATDLFEIHGHQYLVLIDYYSRWLEVKSLPATTSAAVCQKLKEIFMIHGLPDHVHYDNGPQFVSKTFRDFAAECGFSHTTSSPHFHQANGLAERAVQTAKKILELDDPMMGLLDYRSTPCSATGVSPAEALMSRKLKTRLPILDSQLQPRVANSDALRAHDLRAKQLQKTAYDRRHGTRNLPPLREGDQVLLKTEEEKRWLRSGKVTGTDPTSRTYWVATPTGTLRRNRKHIAPGPVPAAPAKKGTLAEESSLGRRSDIIFVAPTEVPPAVPDRVASPSSAQRRSLRPRQQPAHFRDYLC